MTITMYKLLGLVKDDKAPRKIKCFNYNFIYTGDKRLQRFYKLVNQDNYLLRDFVYTLNTKVEIIEESQEHKIPEKFKVHSWGDKDKYGNYVDSPFPTEKELMDKINEILDYLEVNNGIMD